MFSKKIESIQEKTEVIVLPEMFSTGFTMNVEALSEGMNDQTLQWMKKTAADKRVIIAGSIIIEEDKKYFNRLIWMLPTGEYGYYDKRHLFAYGNEHTKFTAGNKRVIASVKGWKLNLQVCYDLRFPVWARQSPFSAGEEPGVTPEYDVLLYVANWPQQRIYAWKSLLVARAIENQCYVVGVNRVGNDGNNVYHNGNSMIIDPTGEIVYQKENEEDIFSYTFQKERIVQTRKKFPFWKDADSFHINL